MGDLGRQLRPVATGAVLATAIVAATLGAADTATATQAGSGDLAPYLPPDARLLQVMTGDTDADGQADTVALYARPASSVGTERVTMLVLRGHPEARVVHRLLGEQDLDDVLELEAGETVGVAVRDVNADGLSELVVTATTGARRRIPTESLRIFRWNGTGYALAAAVFGQSARISGEDGALDVRSEFLGPPTMLDGPFAEIGERYTWRGGGYRLAAREIRLLDRPVSATDPELAVLLHYAALDRGDLSAAYALMTPELRAATPYERFAAGFANTRSVQVEELYPVEGPRPDPPLHVSVYVRIRAVDQIDGSLRSATYAGIWRVRVVDGRWELERAAISPTADLTTVADALPVGADIVRTTQGNVRGSGVADLGVLVKRMGVLGQTRPAVLLRAPDGVQLYWLDELVGADPDTRTTGTLLVDDLNGDGRPEFIYGAMVSPASFANEFLLWVVGWDGHGLAPLFVESSNVPFGQRDLDGDGSLEIIMTQSGECGSHESSPWINFVFRSRGGAYRPASAEFPSEQSQFAEDARNRRRSYGFPLVDDDTGAALRACAAHMQATSSAIQGRAREAREAYEEHRAGRGSSARTRALSLPLYVGSPFFEAEIRELIARADSGRLGDWAPGERAILDELLADALAARKP